MRRYLLTIILPLVVLLPARAQRTLVWSEEFDGEGQVDTSRWTFEHGFVRNKEYQWYQQDNARQEDGCLVIEARWDSLAQHPITSASINTSRSFQFLYGQLEVRAKIPAVIGSWPAIWLLGTDTLDGRRIPWPSCGEIDVMEYYHIKGVPHILANTAWGGNERWKAVWNTQTRPLSHFEERDPLWACRFHTWLMDWTPDDIRIYLDGELLNHTSLSRTVNGKMGGHRNPFHAAQYILLNLAIGGINGGEPRPQDFPLRYLVDYVRVYKNP